MAVVGGLIRFALQGTYPTSPANQVVTTGHVQITGSGSDPDDADVDALLSALSTWWTSGLDGEVSLRSRVVGGFTLVNIAGQKLQPAPPATTRLLSVGTAGSIVSAGFPPQVAAVASLRTAVAGRSYRGRMYVPGIPRAYSSGDDGVINATDAQGLADCFDGMRRHIDGMFGGFGQLVVYSRKNDEATKVTSIRVGRTLDIQRRRKIPGETYLVGT